MVDAYISDVTVVLDSRYQDQPKTSEAVEQLKALGMNVRNVDEDASVVEGDINANKLHELEHLDCVDYVRTVFTYAADYPPGDPRDLDGTAGG
jgi:ribosomal protein L4